MPEPQRASAPNPGEARMFFYPERGQSEATQDRDRYECYRWAVSQSGSDPGMTPLRQPWAAAPAAVPRDGAPVIGGAAAGAIVGATLSSPRHAGEGAVLGAIFGAMLGAASQEARAQAIEQRQAARQDARQQAQEAHERNMEPFRRAMGACMAARGYRVN